MVDPFDSFRSREPRVPTWLARDLGLDPSTSLRNAKRVSSRSRRWSGLRRTPRFQAAEATAAIPLFEGLSKNERRLASRLSTPIAVPAGAMLTQQGAPGSEFFILLEGEVEVFQGGKVVATRGPGSPLGETALLESRAAYRDAPRQDAGFHARLRQAGVRPVALRGPQGLRAASCHLGGTPRRLEEPC